MNKQNNHIIHKQVIELELTKQKGAWELQQMASRLFQQEVQKALSNYLDTLAGPHEVIRISSLEIDLGNISPEQFDRVFPEKCREAIEKAIQKAIKDQYFRRDSNVSATETNEDLYKEINQQESLVEAFFYFLENGTLPWFAQSETLKALEKAVIEVLTNNPNGLKQALKNLPTDYPIFGRLVKQFTLSFRSELMQILWPDEARQLKDLEQVFNSETDSSETKYYHQSLHTVWWLLVIQEQRISEEEVKNLEQKVKEISHLFSGEKKHHALLEQVFDRLRTLIGIPLNREAASSQEKGNGGYFQEKGNRGYFQENGSLIPQANQPFAPLKKTKTITDNPRQSEFFIANAGLVIAALYFKPLFEGFGWLEDKNFISKAIQQKAIHITQYLVTGEQQPAEFDLTLNKILCGWPVSETLDRNTPLSEHEMQEAMSLLEAIVKHWTMLGNSSIEALQSTFLQRKGKLTYESGIQQWILNVEKTGFDICVERLPWTISVIKLPWMTDKLIVDWV